MRYEDSSVTPARSRERPALSAQHLIFILIIGAYFVIGALFAIYVPPWQSPDEPAHYNYIAQVAARGCCPLIEVGDWNLAYLSQLTGSRFDPALLDELDTLQYEDHQPPLYYLIAAPLFNLSAGNLTVLRLLSVVIGAGVVLYTYRIGNLLLPERPWVALGAAALVAFLPQHVAMMASVNNDTLAECLIAITLWTTLRYLKDDNGRWVMAGLGVLVGLGFLTKISTYFLAGIVPLAIFLKWGGEFKVGDRSVGARHAVPLRDLLRRLALFFIPALLLGAVWWARDLSVYGWPDFLGLARHNRVVADQPRTADTIAENGWGAYLSVFFGTTFNSFWGQFGWMGVPMPEWIYRVIQFLLAAVGGGLLLDFFVLRRRAASSNPPWRRNAWIALTLTAVLAVLAYLYYNTEFLQHQGRYLFPGLIPFALWMALGVDAWTRLLFSGHAAMRPYAQWLAAVAFLPLALLDTYLLWRVIVPGLSLSP